MHFLSDRFCTKDDLMLHRNNHHREKVSECINVVKQQCTYADEDCWFSHVTNEEVLNMSEFKCNSCGEKFTRRPEFMNHRKIKHSEQVSFCRHAIYVA